MPFFSYNTINLTGNCFGHYSMEKSETSLISPTPHHSHQHFRWPPLTASLRTFSSILEIYVHESISPSTSVFPRILCPFLIWRCHFSGAIFYNSNISLVHPFQGYHLSRCWNITLCHNYVSDCFNIFFSFLKPWLS